MVSLTLIAAPLARSAFSPIAALRTTESQRVSARSSRDRRARAKSFAAPSRWRAWRSRRAIAQQLRQCLNMRESASCRRCSSVSSTPARKYTWRLPTA